MKMTDVLEKPKRDMDIVIAHVKKPCKLRSVYRNNDVKHTILHYNEKKGIELFKLPLDFGAFGLVQIPKEEWADRARDNGINVKRSWTIRKIKQELMKL